ncbi:MAG: uncharacterized protein QOG69_2626 [Actinomycetota bacterium]|nr:uncharacterized protein [Actinomycetota bacterium]
MSFSPALRSLVVGVVAAMIVVAAYAWGHGGRAAAAAAPTTVNAVASPAPGPGAGSGGNGISVGGTGRVTGKPNLLRLQTSVDVTKPTVNAAMQEANTVMANVQKTLKQDGVADADLQTSGLSVQPNYDYSGGTSRLVGYLVSENLSVVLRNLATAGSIITDAARVGGNELRIGGATLDLDEDDALIAQARQNAFADAEAKAKAYARAAGRTLGAVTSISESTTTPPTPQPYAYDMASGAAASAPVPIQAGSQDVTVNVSVMWALG